LPPPFRLGADTVTGDPWLVMHNGDAPPHNTVEQGGLSDIRTSHNGYKAWHTVRMR